MNMNLARLRWSLKTSTVCRGCESHFRYLLKQSTMGEKLLVRPIPSFLCFLEFMAGDKNWGPVPISLLLLNPDAVRDIRSVVGPWIVAVRPPLPRYPGAP